MYYFSDNFSKIAKRLTFNIDDLKFRDMAKYLFLKLNMTKSNFKNIVMMSFK